MIFSSILLPLILYTFSSIQVLLKQKGFNSHAHRSEKLSCCIPGNRLQGHPSLQRPFSPLFQNSPYPPKIFQMPPKNFPLLPFRKIFFSHLPQISKFPPQFRSSSPISGKFLIPLIFKNSPPLIL